MKRFALPLILLFNCLWLLPELRPVPDLNDNVLHRTLINGMVKALEYGQDPLDFFTPEIGLGQNIVRYYQPAGHLMVAVLYFLCFKLVSIGTLFLTVKFLALALIPLTFFCGARLLELPEDARIAAAMLAPLVSGDSFGIDYGSYVWGGTGLFPQAIATHFLILAIGTGWKAIHRGRTWILPALLLSLTGWSNLLYGYAGGVILCVMAAMPGANLKTLLKIGAAGLLAALPKITAWADREPIPANGLERPWMTDSYGATRVLSDLFTGKVFDQGRWAILTLLVVIGLIYAYRSKKHPAVFWGFAVMLALYFGRPFWGPVLYLAGVTRAMQLHRFIGPLQIFGVFLAGIALAQIRQRVPGPYGLLGIALFLAPATQERASYLSQNGVWIEQSRQAFQSEQFDIDRVLNIARERDGRTYAGMPYNWGQSFKIGSVPVYSLFPPAGIPCVGYLYIGLTAQSNSMYGFREQYMQFRAMDIKTVVRPAELPPIPNTHLIASPGRFRVYSVD